MTFAIRRCPPPFFYPFFSFAIESYIYEADFTHGQTQSSNYMLKPFWQPWNDTRCFEKKNKMWKNLMALDNPPLMAKVMKNFHFFGIPSISFYDFNDSLINFRWLLSRSNWGQLQVCLTTSHCLSKGVTRTSRFRWKIFLLQGRSIKESRVKIFFVGRS